MNISQWVLDQLPARIAELREARIWCDAAMGVTIDASEMTDIDILTAIGVWARNLRERAELWEPLKIANDFNHWRHDREIIADLVNDHGNIDDDGHASIKAGEYEAVIADQPWPILFDDNAGEPFEISEKYCGTRVHGELVSWRVNLAGQVIGTYRVSDAQWDPEPGEEPREERYSDTSAGVAFIPPLMKDGKE